MQKIYRKGFRYLVVGKKGCFFNPLIVITLSTAHLKPAPFTHSLHDSIDCTHIKPTDRDVFQSLTNTKVAATAAQTLYHRVFLNSMPLFCLKSKPRSLISFCVHVPFPLAGEEQQLS